MKTIYALFILYVSSISSLIAQDCSGNRYFEQIFTQVNETLAVQYGSNLNGAGTENVTLLLDIYSPQGDNDSDRPLVILAFGGAFIAGDRSQMAEQARYLAKMGYVVASIDYRLLNIFDFNVIANIEVEYPKAVLRATHDMRAAIRFFKKSVAENGNPYGINDNLIIVGGVSAGAIISNHVAYLNEESEIPSAIASYAQQQGGVQGNSGNPGFESQPELVISLCGAIADTSWMQVNDVPFVGLHNQYDEVVPNISGYPNISVTIPMMLYGDSAMHLRASNLGIDSRYQMYPGSGHCEFPVESADFVTDFLHYQICELPALYVQHTQQVLFSVYPNPSNDFFFVDVPGNKSDWKVSIVNNLGQEVYHSRLESHLSRLQISSQEFEQGWYTVKLFSDGKESATKRLAVYR